MGKINISTRGRVTTTHLKDREISKESSSKPIQKFTEQKRLTEHPIRSLLLVSLRDEGKESFDVFEFALKAWKELTRPTNTYIWRKK